jgi:prepilin-type N-terminal cleavage/methylation domain-containing protein
MKRLRLASKVRKALQGSSRGFTLIEVLVALALVGIIAIAFLGGLSTASRAVLTADVRTTAESLARTQIEDVKNQDYIDYSDPDREPPEYYLEIDEYPEHYDIEVEVEPIYTDPETGESSPYSYNEESGAFDGDDGIQKITVVVSHDYEVVVTLVSYKVDR